MIRDPVAQAYGSCLAAGRPTRSIDLDPGSAALRALSGTTALFCQNPPRSSRTSAGGAMIRDPVAQAYGSCLALGPPGPVDSLDPGSTALRALSGMTAIFCQNPPLSSRTSAGDAMIRDPGSGRRVVPRSRSARPRRSVWIPALRRFAPCRDDSHFLPEPTFVIPDERRRRDDPGPRLRPAGRTSLAVGLAQTFGLDPGSAALRALSGTTAIFCQNPPLSSRTSAGGAMIRDPVAQACRSVSPTVGPAQTSGLDPGSAALRALSGMTASFCSNPPLSSRTSAAGAMIRDPAAQACGWYLTGGRAGPDVRSGSRLCGASRLVRDDSFNLSDPPLSSRTSVGGAMIRDPVAQACEKGLAAGRPTRSIDLDPGSAALRALSGTTAIFCQNPPLSSRTSAGGAMIRDPGSGLPSCLIDRRPDRMLHCSISTFQGEVL